MRQFKDPLRVYLILLGLFTGALLAAPFITLATSTYTGRFGLEMPERGDIAWDDAIRLNHKIQEVALMPVLDGNLVFSGVTPSGTTTQVTWSSGWVKISGVSYYITSGVTNITDNAINWLSAVTKDAATNQVTMQVRSTEYDLPSGASGFAHVPIAALTVEAGNIVRFVDLRHMPMAKYSQDQELTSGSTPTFQGLVVRDKFGADEISAISGATMPSGTSPAVTPSGGLAVDTNDKTLRVGVAGQPYDLPLEEVLQIIVPTPASLSAKSNMPLFTNGGCTFYLTGVTMEASGSGASVEGIAYSLTRTNLQFGAGVTLFNYSSLSTAGTSVWWVAYSGVTAIPPYRTVLMDYGYATLDWLKFTFSGYYAGHKP